MSPIDVHTDSSIPCCGIVIFYIIKYILILQVCWLTRWRILLMKCSLSKPRYRRPSLKSLYFAVISIFSRNSYYINLLYGFQ